MALLKFLKGDYARLGNAAISEGQILICGDTGEMFVDVAADKRVKIGDFTVVANLTALEALDATSVPTSRLYYVEEGNILARSNGTTWVQVNKQPTIAELKVQLGLGDLAYLSEVAESNLNSDLAKKINDAVAIQHSHSNKDVIDGITSDKVSAWDSAEQNAKDYADDLDEAMDLRVQALEAIDHSHTFVESELNKIVDGDVAKWNAAEQNAKDYADGLNTAMNGRVEALEAIDHSHSNKELLDTYTQTEANLADAVAKKHSHSFNETELNKIVEGDVAKWNGVAADHLTSADKTSLENLIKEAKKAGTDANTNIETYKVTNDARVLAVEEDIAEIVDGTNGILAQAKSYSDGKLATARTEISAEIDADVKVVADDLAGYKSSNDTALAGVKATAEAAATKEYTDAELAKKVDKVEGKSLISDPEITRLAGMSTGANKVEKSDTNGNIKIDGVETVVYTHPEKHTVSDISDFETKIASYDYATKTELGNVDKKFENYKTAADQKLIDDEQDRRLGELEAASATHATKDELGNVDKKFELYTTTEAQEAIDAEQDRRLGVIEGDYLKAADIANFETKENVKKVADDLAAYVESNDAAVADRYTKSEADAKFALIADAYDDTALSNRIKAIEDDYLKAEHKTALEGLISAEQQRAEGIEGGLRTDVNTILGDYLKASDKTELEGKITAEENRAKGVESGLDTRVKAIEDDYLTSADKTALQDQITANANAITVLTDGIDPDKIDGLTDLVNWANEHAPEVESIKSDIEANAKAISDQATSDAATYETKTDASAKLVEAKEYADGVVATEKSAREAADAELSEAIEAARVDSDNKDAVVLAESQAYTDAAKAEAIADAASKYETKGTAQGIVDGLKLSETYEPIGAEDRAIAAAEAKVNALAGNVYTKEEVYTKAEVESLLTWGSF